MRSAISLGRFTNMDGKETVCQVKVCQPPVWQLDLVRQDMVCQSPGWQLNNKSRRDGNSECKRMMNKHLESHRDGIESVNGKNRRQMPKPRFSQRNIHRHASGGWHP